MNLSLLNLPSNLIDRLSSSGMKIVEDIPSSPFELRSEILRAGQPCDSEEAVLITRTIRRLYEGADDEIAVLPLGGEWKSGLPGGCQVQNALELLQVTPSHVLSMCERVDKILGGGIPTGSVTELCGLPGTGKTQFCFQLCISCQIPIELGGLGSKSLFIDTEGTFCPERVEQMAQNLSRHIHNLQADLGAIKAPAVSEDSQTAAAHHAILAEMNWFSVTRVMEDIQYARAYNLVDLMALVLSLPTYLSKHPDVRVIVIDSIAAHFRHSFHGNYYLRTRLLLELGHELNKLSHDLNIAIILTNHMTTRWLGTTEQSLQPSLGDSWAHCCSHRCILSIRSGIRYFTIVKSTSNPLSEVTFHIGPDGVRDTTSEFLEAEESHQQVIDEEDFGEI